jgi:hypothetical protein
MAIINRAFQGKMNFDASPNRMDQNDYGDALNITKDAQGSGQDKIISNVVGNQRVLYNLPTGTNKRIGSKEDELRNVVYYFIWNSYSQHLILMYSRTTDSITKIIANLTDTSGVDVLQFNPSKKINHIDIVYRDEGDLLSWTDGNTSPKEINVTTILAGTYGAIQTNFIEAAKRPPLTPPTCVYQNDSSRSGNSLRKKLFQFSHAFVYDTYSVSTPSSFSKIPLPNGDFGSDQDTDSTNNNNIAITVETGDKNVTDIEIYMRNNIEDAWSNFVTIIRLNKAQLNIPNNSTYQYVFYNDNIYPLPTQNFQYIIQPDNSVIQTVPLFDWLPQLADCQCQPNGNVKAYLAITENYNNYPVSDLDVTLTATNETNSPPDATPPQMTYSEFGSGSGIFTFTITGTVPTGTVYRIVANIHGVGVTVLSLYTSLGGDSTTNVATGLYNSTSGTYALNHSLNVFQAGLPSGSTILQATVTAGSGGGGGGITSQKTWLWDCPYGLGIVYVDEQNRDMPGVTTYANPAGGDNDFVVNTSAFSLSGTTPQTPVLNFTINHLPPEGAVAYHIVRRRLAYATFMFYETCDYDSDDGYLYFCLGNIEKFKEKNSQFIYGTVPVVAESRIKIIASVTTGSYNGTLFSEDYSIVGVEKRTVTGGSSPADDANFVKVVKPTSVPSYANNMLVMIYTPLGNPTSDADSVYWEWGEKYDVYTLNGVNYHRGLDQDQTASQAAEFTFIEGDVYYRTRQMNRDLNGNNVDTLDLMDGNYSDYFNSLVNDNGRGQAIEVNARKQFNPVLVRFSLAYQNGTNINGLNRFYPENFDEYDRSWGNVVKAYIDKRYMYVGQTFNVGIVPILQQIVTDTAGNPLQANSDELLNKIQYPYDKQFGYGNCPESFAFAKGALYGFDNNKGVAWRLAQDGMIALSVLYEMNAFFVPRSPAYKTELNNGYPIKNGVYTGNPTVYGVFDSYTNKYILALEEINRYNSQGYLTFHQDAETVCFLETRDSQEGFETRFSYHPEGMVSLNNLLISFKDGALWKHDSETYCNFFGIQYPCYIDGVFNDNILEKKSWEALTQISNTIWECPVIYTNVMSYRNQRQESRLIEDDFTTFEEYPSAAILRDTHSVGSTYNGDFLKGGFMVIRFLKQNASSLITLSGVSVLYKDSPLTAK